MEGLPKKEGICKVVRDGLVHIYNNLCVLIAKRY